MENTADQTISDILTTAVMIGVIGLALGVLLSRLKRSRPGLAVGLPLAIAFVIRIVAAAGTSLTGFAESLRGPDEIGIVARAQEIADGAQGAASYGETAVTHLHEFIVAVQLAALDSPDLALRATQAGIAVAGLLFLVVAVYELAGPRASTIAMWVLAIEPTNIFFSTLLHKESGMILASGLVAFGGAVLWRSGSLRGLLPMALGCGVAVATRPYAGWFLIAASAAITLHAGLRQETRGSLRGVSIVAGALLLVAVAAPTVFEASSDESLEQNLQVSQDANVADPNSNLNFEQVDLSSRSAILTGLPIRVRDLVLRPYPWEINNTSQQLGLMGTVVVLVLLALLVGEVARNRGRIMGRAAPLVYTAFFLLVAYSLSAGNAGTAFRYRMHLVAVALCVLVVVWWLRSSRDASSGEAHAAHGDLAASGKSS